MVQSLGKQTVYVNFYENDVLVETLKDTWEVRQFKNGKFVGRVRGQEYDCYLEPLITGYRVRIDRMPTHRIVALFLRWRYKSLKMQHYVDMMDFRYLKRNKQ